MYYQSGPHKRYEYSPTEKRNRLKFAAFFVFMVGCGMAFGWFLIQMLSR